MGTTETDSEAEAQQPPKEQRSPEKEKESPEEPPQGPISETTDPLNTYKWHTGSRGALNEMKEEGGATSTTSTLNKIQKASTNKWNKMQNWRKALSEETTEKNSSGGKGGEGAKQDKGMGGVRKNPFRRALSEPPGSLFTTSTSNSNAAGSANAASSSAAEEASGVSPTDASQRAGGGARLKKYMRVVSQKFKRPKLQSRSSTSALLTGNITHSDSANTCAQCLRSAFHFDV